MSLRVRLQRSVVTSVLVLALSPIACTGPAAEPVGPAETYAMRGEIVRFAPPGEREIAIRHEAVPDFRDASGKVVGMEAMTMPFTLAADLPKEALSGLAPGDRIAFTLEMRWQDPREIARVTRIEKLPAGARLAWDPPPAGAPAPATGAPGTAQ